MSADYWNLTQRKFWKFTRNELETKRRNVEIKEESMMASGILPIHIKDISYDTEMRIYLHIQLQKLGGKLNMRAVPLSTAEVYMLRFLSNVSLKEVNLYLLITTCTYLACKIEEAPQHIRTVSNEARNLWPEYIPHDLTKIAEFEFYLIEEMDNYLIVHNPYKALSQLKTVLAGATFSLNGNTGYSKATDNVNCLVLTQQETEAAWQIVNDAHATDLPLLFPPHIIAVTAVYMAVVLGSGRTITVESPGLPTKPGLAEGRLEVLTNFMAVSGIHLQEVMESVQEILTLYEVWDTAFDEVRLRKRVQNLFLNR